MFWSLYKLQQASYQIEAELIQLFEIAPFKESIEDLMECEENFLKNDYKLIGDIEVAPGLFIGQLEKRR